ncbi:unnamed protein product [Linum trigynum]|uniref:Transmembrane protein n=1 Tax=Linum trigynum TaxID=586398 RepID=A0AAV2EBF5_9ROSI
MTVVILNGGFLDLISHGRSEATSMLALDCRDVDTDVGGDEQAATIGFMTVVISADCGFEILIAMIVSSAILWWDCLLVRIWSSLALHGTKKKERE